MWFSSHTFPSRFRHVVQWSYIFHLTSGMLHCSPIFFICFQACGTIVTYNQTTGQMLIEKGCISASSSCCQETDYCVGGCGEQICHSCCSEHMCNQQLPQGKGNILWRVNNQQLPQGKGTYYYVLIINNYLREKLKYYNVTNNYVRENVSYYNVWISNNHLRENVGYYNVWITSNYRLENVRYYNVWITYNYHRGKVR